MRTKWRVTLALTLVASSRPAIALDVCVTMLQPLLNPVGQEYNCWDPVIYTPFPLPNPACAHPACCTPGVCKVSPECGVARIIYETIAQAGDIHCFAGISGQDLFDMWVNGQVAFTADVMTGGTLTTLYPIYNGAVDALTADAKPLPESVQALLRSTLPPPGQSRFTRSDISRVRVIDQHHNAFTEAALGSQGGITVGPVVILRSDRYSDLMNSRNWGVGAYELVMGNASWEYARAVLLVMHELVHFHQFVVEGRESFQTNYTLRNAPFITRGYGFDPREQEAYGYEKTVAEYLGGGFCIQMKDDVDSDLQKYLPSTAPVTCRPVRDSDGDRVLDPLDNCPRTVNPSQLDRDQNGVGDVCDYQAWFPAVLHALQ